MSLSPNSTRTFDVDLTHPVDPSKDPYHRIYHCTGPKTSHIGVRDLLSVPVGATVLKNGHFQLEITFENGAPGYGYDESFNDHAPDPVPPFSVTRTSQNQWIVTNQQIPGGTAAGFKWFKLPPDYPHSPIGWSLLGYANYYTSVYMTITKGG